MQELHPNPPWNGRVISFEEFMEFCLYHPDQGYYRRKSRPVVGKQGDYLTSPHTHRLFAELVARALASYLRELSGEGMLSLVEMGAGEGRLAGDLLPRLAEEEPELFSRIRYQAVDVENPQLPAAFRGVVFSNEFFDALPVHRVRVRGGRLFEIQVTERAGKLQELDAQPARPEIQEYMESAFSRWREGWVYEINLRMLETVQRIDRSLLQGAVVTIDYGYQQTEYDNRPRPDGTLMCYRHHRAQPDPYLYPGDQDITAHIHFDLLEQAGRRLGWTSEPLISQREFLLKWGLAARLCDEERAGWFRDDRMGERLQLKELLIPGGISDTMKVLVQRK